MRSRESAPFSHRGEVGGALGLRLGSGYGRDVVGRPIVAGPSPPDGRSRVDLPCDRRPDRPPVSRGATDAAARPCRREERHQAHDPAGVRRGRPGPRHRRFQGRASQESGLVPQPAREPDTTVQIGAARCAVGARVATPEERERLWPKAVATYAGYRGYQQRTDREIPLVILEPRRPPMTGGSCLRGWSHVRDRQRFRPRCSS